MHKKTLRHIEKDLDKEKKVNKKNYSRQENELNKAHTKIHKLRTR